MNDFCVASIDYPQKKQFWLWRVWQAKITLLEESHLLDGVLVGMKGLCLEVPKPLFSLNPGLLN